MKIFISILLVLASVQLMAASLDLRKIQSPILDAQASANSVAPKFAAFIAVNAGKPKMPGVDRDQRQVIRKKYGVKVLNEYRLYQAIDKKLSKQDLKENYMLERYCTRYNRHLLNLLGL
ncbi:hypothetical protein A9Q73_08730 [Bermanella sp. 47_1433_sub80_T6]|nr:hypothetical protein A9Q73_08730 [Bermanella sp. 47_1433_sub80_T6]